MNKRQKKVQEVFLKNEREVLKELKHSYARSIAHVDDIIKDLLAQEQTQSKIYQLQYQLQIRSQLTRIYNDMQSNNYATLTEYLQNCYKEGFVGTMYDLQGQGVPLAFPINQEAMVKAVQTDSKVSKGLYKRLGINVNDLKETIRIEISRGVAQGMSYEQIAKAIQRRSDVDYNKSVRIARTEGHRIQQASTLDAQLEAKARGADIKKQWDATLDSVTRDTHRFLDGQIVDVDEEFTTQYGQKAMFPSGFGDPSEDCNCRCCLLQRASWAIGAEDRTKMDNQEKSLLTINDSNYNDFKTAYFNAVGG